MVYYLVVFMYLNIFGEEIQCQKWGSFATGVLTIFLKDGNNHVFSVLRYCMQYIIDATAQY